MILHVVVPRVSWMAEGDEVGLPLQHQTQREEDEGMHVVRPRAAGLDVHKMEITATVRLCEGDGEPLMETRCFSTLPRGLEEMVAWLISHGVEAAVMEGTGVYWQAPFEALERATSALSTYPTSSSLGASGLRSNTLSRIALANLLNPKKIRCATRECQRRAS